MSTPKQSRRKIGAKKLEPIDWHEFANDAVLNGNMSTLYRRPPTEDPTAYASPEALVEIEKRVARPVQAAVVPDSAGQAADPPAPGFTVPPVGLVPPVSIEPSVGSKPSVETDSLKPTVGASPSVGSKTPDSLDPGRGAIVSEAIYNVPTVDNNPTVGNKPTDRSEHSVGSIPPVGASPLVGSKTPDSLDPGRGAIVSEAIYNVPTVNSNPTVGNKLTDCLEPSAGPMPAVGLKPTAAGIQSISFEPRPAQAYGPTVGVMPTVEIKRKVKPIRSVQDAITLAGRVLYNAMYGSPDGAASKTCTKGYRQLAAETHLDKDTVRDLIREFKSKGIIRETGTYNPDTRSSKTYEVLSAETILQIWRNAGLRFVTLGRQRPMFCTPQGELITFTPTVGIQPRGSV